MTQVFDDKALDRLGKEVRAQQILIRELQTAIREMNRSQHPEQYRRMQVEAYAEAIRAIRAATQVSDCFQIWLTNLYPPPYKIAAIFTEILIGGDDGNDK